MNKEYYIKITLAVYKVTDIFPEQEPLRRQIRELANKVLADLIFSNPDVSFRKKDLFKNMKILNSYFEIAKHQDWVDSRNFLVLQREYDKIQKFIENKLAQMDLTGLLVPNSIHKKSLNNTSAKYMNNGRQEKILEILKEKKQVRVGELIPGFPQVSRRTIIRDLKALHKTGMVMKNGNGRGVHYNIKL